MPGPARGVFGEKHVEELGADELAHCEGAIGREGKVHACGVGDGEVNRG